MVVAYFDCFAGAAGDMIVGALLDAGADQARLFDALSRLKVPGYTLRTEVVRRGAIAGTKFHVDLTESHTHHHHEEEGQPPHEHHGHEHHEHGHRQEHHHRNLQDILTIIDSGGLPERAAQRARAIFQRLGEAEAAAHHIPIDEVHFHEVGAVDSIVDIIGACIALELLDVDTVVCSPIPLGSGTVECAHGTLPVPAPATSRLVVSAKISPAVIPGEATTPTGAAILTTLAESYGPLPAMQASAVGYGAGTREDGPLPNLLRVFIGEPSQDNCTDSVVELSANLDDCTGEVIGATLDALLQAGCVDAWASPIVMKKSRPAWMLSALCEPGDADEAERLLFQETTTFGVRRRICGRSKLRREWETVETLYGPVRVKLGRRGDRIVTASPEFTDCRSAAEAHHVPAREVYRAAVTQYEKESAQ
jgi:pyridinium-3,5-bisthiocarboxylic acid mononucleotide nickel chelatase